MKRNKTSQQQAVGSTKDVLGAVDICLMKCYNLINKFECAGRVMKYIRQATAIDLPRIAEIIIFNYRLNFYPIFRNDDYYFNELQVPKLMEQYESIVGNKLRNDFRVKFIKPKQGKDYLQMIIRVLTNKLAP